MLAQHLYISSILVAVAHVPSHVHIRYMAFVVDTDTPAPDRNSVCALSLEEGEVLPGEYRDTLPFSETRAACHLHPFCHTHQVRRAVSV